MIIKKIKAQKSAKSRTGQASRARTLIGYVCGEHNDESLPRTPGEEKVLFYGGQGFIGDSLKAWQEEMALLATEARIRSTPIDHWILSWRENEVPTREQITEAIDVFLKQLGIDKEEQYQYVYALHKNTRNVHLHIVLNRTHPVTHKVHSVEFAYKAAQRAAALIEHIQGWQPEKGARFVVEVDNNGELHCRPKTESLDEEEIKTNPSSKAQDFERRTGQKSNVRELLEDKALANAIKTATSWEELHHRLHELGAWYGKSGSGATLYYKGQFWKASELGRFASLGNLKKKLGEFTPSPYDRPTTAVNNAPTPQPLKKVAATEWKRYQEERTSPDFYQWLQKEADPLVAEQWLRASPNDDPVPLSTLTERQISPPTREIPTEAVYAIHKAFVARSKSRLDESIIDSEIALRMRANGYKPEEIIKAIKNSSNKYKLMKSDPEYYTERITQYAFSPYSTLMLSKDPKLAMQWRHELTSTIRTYLERRERNLFERGSAQQQKDRER